MVVASVRQLTTTNGCYGKKFRTAAGRIALSHAADVNDGTGVSLHARAQIGNQRVIEHELAEAIGDLVGGEGPETLRRRNVGARGERAESTLLFLRKVPGEIQLCRVRMWRILENS